MTETAFEGAAVPTAEADVVLRAIGIDKAFFGVQVLRGVSLEVRRGEVHGLVGENGAGKSTLMKVLAGVYQADAGTVEFDGRTVAFTHPLQSMNAGLVTVFQEFNLLPERTVAQNVSLGREPRKGLLMEKKWMIERTWWSCSMASSADSPLAASRSFTFRTD